MSDDDESLFRYRMDHGKRGRFIIINNKKFEPQTTMVERTGTDEDAKTLKADFEQFGFDVEVKDNLTAKEMLKLMVDGKLLN